MRTHHLTTWLAPALVFSSLVVLAFVIGFALGDPGKPVLPDANVTSGSAPAPGDIESGVRPARAPLPADLSLAVAAAEGGDAKAQLQLGMVYMTGTGVERNPATAMKWIEKSAEQGYAEAQYALGNFHRSGLGTPQNFLLSFKWCERAAEQNHAEAKYCLGMMYSKGQGLVVDKSMAYIWFNLAAAQGHERAGVARDNLLSILTLEQLLAAQRATQRWQPAQANE